MRYPECLELCVVWAGFWPVIWSTLPGISYNILGVTKGNLISAVAS